LAGESFAQIDRGDFQVVEPASIDQFMTQIDSRIRTSKPR
jgi:hypothetical protein